MLVTVTRPAKGLLCGTRARVGKGGQGRLSCRLAETGSSLCCTSSLAKASTATSVPVSTSVDRVDDGRAVGSVVRPDHGRVRQPSGRVKDKREVGALGCDDQVGCICIS